MKLIDANDVVKKWEKSPSYRKAYQALESEFALAQSLISARVQAGMTQKQVAQKMGTTQSAIARIESGQNPSIKTLQRYATAIGGKALFRVDFAR